MPILESAEIHWYECIQPYERRIKFVLNGCVVPGLYGRRNGEDWVVTVANNYCYRLTNEELGKFLPIYANGVAIALGYEHHGSTERVDGYHALDVVREQSHDGFVL